MVQEGSLQMRVRIVFASAVMPVLRSSGGAFPSTPRRSSFRPGSSSFTQIAAVICI